MKILLINKYHYLKGGAERAYFDMARILVEHGHEVAFFSMHDPNNVSTTWERYFVESVDYGALDLSLVERLRMAGRILWNHEANRKLAALLQEFQPDIAHAHNIYHQLSPSILWTLRKHDVPIVMTLHDYKVISPNYSLFVRGQIWDHTSGLRCLVDRCVKDSVVKSLVCAIEQWLHRLLRSYTLVTVFVAPSRFLQEKFQAHRFSGHIEHLPNSLPARDISSETHSHHQKRFQNFLFFGRLSQEKGVDVLIRAFASLPPHMTLDVVGDGPHRTILEKLAETLGVSSRVRFLGSRFGSDLESLKQDAFAVIIPSSWYENFPYVITESLQSGCLLLAARIGGIPERIQHGENGFLFEPCDPESLVSVILSLDRFDLEAIRKQASASVIDLSESVFYEHLMGIYRMAAMPRS